MDDFTRQHLTQWAERQVYPEDFDEFMEYAVAAVEDDPEYDWDWTILYRTFLRRK